MNIFSDRLALAVVTDAMQVIGWVLVHSVWLFAVTAVAAWLLLKLLRDTSATVRYNVLLGVLAVFVIGPVAMAWRTAQPGSAVAVSDNLQAPSTNTIRVNDDAASDFFDHETGRASSGPVGPSEESVAFSDGISGPAAVDGFPDRIRLRQLFEPWLTTIVRIWCCGVFVFAMRLGLGRQMIQHLKSHGIRPVPAAVEQMLQRLAAQLQIQRQVGVFQSELVTSPLLAGGMKSVILLPVGFVAGVPPAQLEAVLAHELIHVRRHDLLVNFLQTVMETVFFYHPAVWWLSQRIRIEREHCCDDQVVALLGNPSEYGRALLAIEEFRGAQTSLALSAGGGSLVRRIRRLLADPHPERSRGAIGLTVAALLVSVGVLAGGFMTVFSGPPEVQRIDRTESNSVKVEFPGGGSVELIAVQDLQSEQPRTWHPSGLSFGSAPVLPKWHDSVHKFSERARHAVFRWEGIPDVRGAAYRAEDLRLSLNPDDRGLARVIIDPGVLTQSVDIRIGLSDEEWGPWIDVDVTGKRLEDKVIPPACRDAYESILPDHVESRVGSVVFCWSGMSGVEDKARFQLVAVDRHGEARDSSGRTAWDGPNGPEAAEVFALTEEEIDHFRYRLCPYRHWAVFQNVSLQPRSTGAVVRSSLETVPVAAPEAAVPDQWWRARGRVTDASGSPLQGVTIRVATGVGSLRGGGTGTTDAAGRYDVPFGPGMLFGDIADEEPSPQTQAAIVYAHLPGYFERNLCRHGGGIASLRAVSEEDLKTWSVRPEQVCLPDRPRVVDFVMLPAARVAGILVGEDDQPLEGYSVALDADNLPPGSSVLTAEYTDADGRFVLTEIPTTQAFQFVIRKPRAELKPPWEDSWASAPVLFEDPGGLDFRAVFRRADTVQSGTSNELSGNVAATQLRLKIVGPGVHGRTAVAEGRHGALMPLMTNIDRNAEGGLLTAAQLTLTLSNQPARPAESPPR